MSEEPVTMKAEAEKAVKVFLRAAHEIPETEAKIRIGLSVLRGENCTAELRRRWRSGAQA